MVKGKVLRFDEARGYGFIAPDGGGEDVFVHINDLGAERAYIKPGVAVEFDVEDSERGGLKASSVRVLGRASTETTRRPTVSGRAAAREPDDDGLCDVLSDAEFRQEVTETLLKEASSLTGAQVLAVRENLLRLAREHGWVET
ncbi:DNA-binding protein [Micromonospora qiuiae]|uniref:DNA-binding protein n=1 Tax=Micromonospora qiuiae TaxID=502268 RepID=A0ABQ4JKU5_9ACTN|nr:cold shock domain-containing protein [Micromonospora qiuiae]GIJ30176.1 DNA-binding protein [Micromonospora qiuiae]